jgi:hypothetical protein
MASITTQTVGAASAGAVATVVNAVREVVAIKRPERAQLSTEEADRVTLSTSSRDDQERTPAEPKRAEAPFARTPLAKA